MHFATLPRNLTCAMYVSKSSSSRNFEKFPFNKEVSLFLTRVASLQYTFCNATKYELLTKFLEGAFKFTENFQEVISNGVPYQKFTELQTAAFSLASF